MQKPSFNVMIFDDDQQVSNGNQMKKYTSISMSKNVKQSSFSRNMSEKNYDNGNLNNISKNDEQITNQLRQLQIKINKLQKQGEKIKKQLKRNDLTSSNVMNKTSNNNQNNQQYKQIQQVLFTVQKKIQLIIQQSRKLITKLTQNFDKKLNLSNNSPQQQNNHQIIKNSSPSLPQHYKHELVQLQQQFLHRNSQYQQSLHKKYLNLLNDFQQKQSQMLIKLTQIQQKFINKCNTYETKEKEEIEIKRKNKKKMITITQEKPQLHEIVNKNNGERKNDGSSNLENIPVNNTNYQTVKNNTSVDHHNNSKITRKHKIFGNKQLSPAAKQQKVTPTKDIQQQKSILNKQFNAFNYETTFQSNIASQLPTNPTTRPVVHNNNFLPQPHPQPQTLPLKPQPKPTNLGFYNQLRSQTQRQFYKNIPQANSAWDKFADMNQLSGDYNQSQSDDFFNPIENYQYQNGGQFIDSYHQMGQTHGAGQQQNGKVVGNGNLQQQVLNSKSNNYYNNANNIDNGYNKMYQQQEHNNNSNNHAIHTSGGQEKVFSPFDLN